MKYLYSEWGDYTIGKELIGATIFVGVFPLIAFLFSIKSPIQNFDNVTKKGFFATVILASLVFFSIIYALFYFVISKRKKLISKHPIFTYILEFFYGFVFCMFYLVIFMEGNGYNISYSKSPIIILLLFILSITIILVCYYKFNDFFINFMDANFNLRDKHWDAYNLDNKYYKNSWVFIFSAIIVCGLIGSIIGDKNFFVVHLCSLLFVYGSYLNLASISCMIYSYKERKEKVSN